MRNCYYKKMVREKAIHNIERESTQTKAACARNPWRTYLWIFRQKRGCFFELCDERHAKLFICLHGVESRRIIQIGSSRRVNDYFHFKAARA